jgi:hypothetical protein
MRQILVFVFFMVICPPVALAYYLFCLVRYVVAKHRGVDRYRYSTPAQREAFQLAHEERLFRVSNIGQTVTVTR